MCTRRTRSPSWSVVARVKARGARAGAARTRHPSYPGSIRIIGGRWRSRRLAVLALEGLRPTPDRVRETLFNWLAPYVSGARCLDLYAGTGALCLEALSRGAAEGVMVEHDAAAARQLRENIARLEAVGAHVVAADALEYLADRASAFDIIFIDPPFAIAEDEIPRCAERLAAGWLKPGGLLYIEAPRAFKITRLPNDWRILKSQTAGQVAYFLARV